MKLEYIIIFKKEGIPIYSRCFGSFCARVGFDESLYSGFLSALTTMPEMFGDNKGLQSVEMGFTKLHFSKTTPSGHNICVGIDKSTIQDVDVENQLDVFYDRINRLMEEKYSDFDWIAVNDQIIEDFENNLLHETIYPSFPYFYDNEVCKEDCPFDHDSNIIDETTNEPITIIDRFKRNYSSSLSTMTKLIAPLYLRIYRWLDLRKYKKKRKESQTIV